MNREGREESEGHEGGLVVSGFSSDVVSGFSRTICGFRL